MDRRAGEDQSRGDGVTKPRENPRTAETHDLTALVVAGRTQILAQFDAKVHAEPNTGCWLWVGWGHGHGYGGIRLAAGVIGRAHRVSYELHVGRIPRGFHVLHRCDQPACVNPEHLHLGDHAANMADMKAKGRAVAPGHNQHKATCPAGHPYNEENTRLYQGRRYCRACHRERGRRLRATQKDAAD